MPPLIMMVPYKKKTPIQIEDTDPMKLAIGNGHSAIIKNDGTLWMTGLNNDGQLATNNTTNRSVFFHSSSNVHDIALGVGYSTRFDLSNRLYSSGRYLYGRLGSGFLDRISWLLIPDFLPDNDPTTSMITSDPESFTTFVVASDGKAYVTGRNNNGQLGLGNTSDRYSFTHTASEVIYACVGSTATFIIKNDKTLWFSGRYDRGNGIPGISQTSLFIQVPDITGAKIISTNYSKTGFDGNSLLIKEDGTLWGTGRNLYGELGMGHNNNVPTFSPVPITDIKYVSQGLRFSFALKNDGTLLATGMNSNGQLGTGDTTNENVFTPVLSDVQRIEAGNYNAIAIKTDGTVWVAGSQSNGQLGTGVSSNTNLINWKQIDFNAKL